MPTTLLFFMATVFITSSIENLFSGQVERSLQESLIVAQIYYQNTSQNTIYFGRQIRQGLTQLQLLEKRNPAMIQEFLKAKRTEFNLEGVEVISDYLGKPVRVTGSNIPPASFPLLESKIIREAQLGEETTKIQSIGQGDLLRGLVPILGGPNQKEVLERFGGGRVYPAKPGVPDCRDFDCLRGSQAAAHGQAPHTFRVPGDPFFGHPVNHFFSRLVWTYRGQGNNRSDPEAGRGHPEDHPGQP
ncbi:MAG: hypothetical protein MZU91_11920 [Desulfosudis oleivorans]|nr:hypothetical protein [Desulfosudis oleivorans]